MTGKADPSRDDLLAAVRQAARQEQFLDVVSAEEARARFERNLDLSPLPGETLTLADALGRVLAHDVVAPIDVPPFDRANVDGFALRASDSTGAADNAPRPFVLNAEVIACGHAPIVEVTPGTATTIATGGVVPRGADAVVMIEHTELIENGPSHRAAARGVARPVHLLRRFRHRARRDAAAAGPDRSDRARSACSRPAALRTSRSCGGRRSRCFRPATNC